MSKIKVIIAETDREYAQTLTGYLIDKSMQLFRINCFTELSCLSDYLKDDRTAADIILTGEAFLPLLTEHAKNKSIPVLVLSESYQDTGRDNVIYKYCNADVIAEKLKNVVKKTPFAFEVVKEGGMLTKNIIFFSPSGNCGCTVLAVNTAISLAGENRKVLYFNLEAVNSAAFYLPSEDKGEGYGLADIIFDIRENSINITESIEKGIIHSKGVSYFRPKENFIEKSDIKIEDIRFIITSIMDKKLFDYIVIDSENIFGKGKIGLLDICDAIFLVSHTDEHSIYKMTELINGIGLYGARNSVKLEGKTHILWNRSADQNFKRELAGDFGLDQSAIPVFSDGILPQACIDKILKGIKYG